MISRRFKVAVVAGGLVGAALVLGFAPAVRYGVGRSAERYGAAVGVERVTPTINGVRLRGVDVTLEEIPSARVHVDEVLVTYTGSGRRVSFQGGVVSAVGARDVVLRQVEAWRTRHLAKPGDAAGGSTESDAVARTTDLSGLRLRWQDKVESPNEALSAADLRIARAPGRMTVEAAQASATLGRATVEIKNGRVELSRDGDSGVRVAGLSADAVEAELTFPLGKETKLDGLAGANTLKPVAARQAGEREGAGQALQRTLVWGARVIDALLDPRAKVRLGGVHARVHHKGDRLNLGPGTLEVIRNEGRLIVELTPDLRGGATRPDASAAPNGTGAPAAHDREEALTFRLAVPLVEGGPPTSQEIVADVQGGPIWLSSLGAREGDFGLFDVGQTSLGTRSHLVLSADGRTLRIDGEGKVHALSVRSNALSDEPVAGLELAFALKGEVDLDGSRARIAECELDLGAIRLVLKGDYDRARGVAGAEDTHHFRGSFDMPLTACQSMLDSTPKGLVPKLQGVRMAGSFALRGTADVDTAHLDRHFKLQWDASSSCRVVEAPAAIHVDRFRRPFRRTAYDPQGRPVEIETGPGTADWVPIRSTSKFMEAAVLTTEDGGFHRHHGFDQEAIRNSIRENLRKKKFVRGASTISMQLAKNLYLDRGKNLSRKLQEAVLTMYLEQALTKDQIMELYLNVVEFGPLVYGIGPAAKHYFDTTANNLSLGQALYISSIMPNPKVQHFADGGEVSRGRADLLRRLMKKARDRKRITDEELDEGLRETVVRGSPMPLRSERPATLGPERGVEPTLPTDGSDD